MVDDSNPDDFAALVERLRVRTKKGSARDLQARRTLARILRSSEPLEVGVRFILADAVDPDRLRGAVTMPEFKRKRGRPQRISDFNIAAFVYRKRQSGQKYRLAVEEAMTEFKASRSKVTSAYRKSRPDIERDPSYLDAFFKSNKSAE
jgi:hypothetical protein